MSKRGAHISCSVVGCQNQHKNVFSLPTLDQATREQWVKFIFNDALPETLPTGLAVCAKHFKPECFGNLGQYQAKLASKLRLERGALPTIRNSPAGQTVEMGEMPLPLTQKKLVMHYCNMNLEKEALPTIINSPAIYTASTSHAVSGTGAAISSKVRHIGCQTRPLVLGSTGTELPPHFRSVGTQTTTVESATDVGFCTSPATFRSVLPWSSLQAEPRMKRPRLMKEDEEEDDGSSSSVAPEAEESKLNPEDSAKVLTELLHVLEDTSPSSVKPSAIPKMRKLLVFEQSLMELFDQCPVCLQVCEIQKTFRGTFMAVWQKCPHCLYQREWKSQPVIGRSTPAGNLHLSTAIYVSGATFFNIQKVFKALQLQMHTHEQFQAHVCDFIEPAVTHRSKSDQAAILSGNMRADAPEHPRLVSKEENFTQHLDSSNVGQDNSELVRIKEEWDELKPLQTTESNKERETLNVTESQETLLHLQIKEEQVEPQILQGKGEQMELECLKMVKNEVKQESLDKSENQQELQHQQVKEEPEEVDILLVKVEETEICFSHNEGEGFAEAGDRVLW